MEAKLYGYLLITALGFVVIIGPLLGVWISNYLEKREKEASRHG